MGGLLTGTSGRVAPTAVLTHLRRAGLTVGAVEGKIRVTPREKLTPEFRALLAEHRGGILEALEAERRVIETPPGRICAFCGGFGWWRPKEPGAPWRCLHCHPPPAADTDAELHFVWKRGCTPDCTHERRAIIDEGNADGQGER